MAEVKERESPTHCDTVEPCCAHQPPHHRKYAHYLPLPTLHIAIHMPPFSQTHTHTHILQTHAALPMYLSDPDSPPLQCHPWWCPFLLSFHAPHPVFSPPPFSPSSSTPERLELFLDSTARDQPHRSARDDTDEAGLSRPQWAHTLIKCSLIRIHQYCRFPSARRKAFYR